MGPLSSLALGTGVVAALVLVGLFLMPTPAFCMLIGVLTIVGGVLLVSDALPLAIGMVVAGILLTAYGVRLWIREARKEPGTSQIAPGLRSNFRVPYDDE